MYNAPPDLMPVDRGKTLCLCIMRSPPWEACIQCLAVNVLNCICFEVVALNTIPQLRLPNWSTANRVRLVVNCANFTAMPIKAVLMTVGEYRVDEEIGFCVANVNMLP